MAVPEEIEVGVSDGDDENGHNVDGKRDPEERLSRRAEHYVAQRSAAECGGEGADKDAQRRQVLGLGDNHCIDREGKDAERLEIDEPGGSGAHGRCSVQFLDAAA